jgi:metal-dependent hydrolase (beta-lactamase superfamily II)
LRSWSTSPLHSAIYTHGHVDHCFGVEIWEEDDIQKNAKLKPQIIGHQVTETAVNQIECRKTIQEIPEI